MVALLKFADDQVRTMFEIFLWFMSDYVMQIDRDMNSVMK